MYRDVDINNPHSADPEEALWRFSLAFYAVPGISEALLALQDRRGFDVNLILFALWLGYSGRGRLDGEMLAAADRAISNIRTDIVKPLRLLRRKLKGHPDTEVQSLREGIKGLELSAEKLVQARLARLAGPSNGDACRAACLAAACANVDLYFGAKCRDLPEAATIRRAVEKFNDGGA